MRQITAKLEALVVCFATYATIALPASADSYADALQYYESGKYEQASALLRDLVKSSPGKAEYRYLLGNTYFAKRLYGIAIPEYAAAISAEPGSAAAKMSQQVLTKMMEHSRLTMPQLPVIGKYIRKPARVKYSSDRCGYPVVMSVWKAPAGVFEHDGSLVFPAGFPPEEECNVRVNWILFQKDVILTDLTCDTTYFENQLWKKYPTQFASSRDMPGMDARIQDDCIRCWLIQNEAEKEIAETRSAYRRIEESH